MAKIKSVVTSSGKRVQVGSKAYDKRITQGGETAVSGTGKNLTNKDIKGIGGGFTDKVSTTFAKQQANAQGEQLPYQQFNEQIGGMGQTASQALQQAPTPNTIQTGQPSPKTVDAGKGLPGATPTAIPSPYEQGWAKLQGTPAPQDAGQGMMGVQGAIPPAEPDMSATDALLQEDKGWQQLLQTKEEYFNPDNQKASLMDTYNKLYKKSGLEQLDEEIMDAKTIIEGTEDDIRNEVEMAGGFGTDSQVQALALSRNKTLLKNYNNLVALRESKEERLNNMLNFAEKDRAYADQQFDRALNYEMQMLNYRQKFTQNAQDQYNKYDPVTLQAMLSGNPRQLAFAEQILGVGPGGIAKMANAYKQSPEYKLKNLQLQKLELENRGLTETPASTQNSLDQLSFLRQTIKEAGELSKASGKSGISRKFGSWFVGDTKYNQLEAKTNTLRTNVLTLMTDPDVKKFFGPQMSEADVRLMTAAGTTLNPEANSPEQMKSELGRLDELLNRMQTAVRNGKQTTGGQNLITAPDGTQVIIVD